MIVPDELPGYICTLSDWVYRDDDPLLVEALEIIGKPLDDLIMIRNGDEKDPLTLRTYIFDPFKVDPVAGGILENSPCRVVYTQSWVDAIERLEVFYKGEKEGVG